MTEYTLTEREYSSIINEYPKNFNGGIIITAIIFAVLFCVLAVLGRASMDNIFILLIIFAIFVSASLSSSKAKKQQLELLKSGNVKAYLTTITDKYVSHTRHTSTDRNGKKSSSTKTTYHLKFPTMQGYPDYSLNLFGRDNSERTRSCSYKTYHNANIGDEIIIIFFGAERASSGFGLFRKPSQSKTYLRKLL